MSRLRDAPHRGERARQFGCQVPRAVLLLASAVFASGCDSTDLPRLGFLRPATKQGHVVRASTIIFLYNVYKTHKHGERVTADDPWGFANSLEWATSCPAPRHNFTSVPRSDPNARHSTCTIRISARAATASAASLM